MSVVPVKHMAVTCDATDCPARVSHEGSALAARIEASKFGWVYHEIPAGPRRGQRVFDYCPDHIRAAPSTSQQGDGQ